MFVRLMKKEKVQLLLFILSVSLMFLCNMKISIDCSVNWLKLVKEAVFTIAGSYIAGYIFYVFSVLVPQLKRQKPIYKVISQLIVYAKSELMELCYNIYGKYNVDKVSFFEKLATKESDDNYIISQKNYEFIRLAMYNIKELTESSAFKMEFLELKDLENMCEVIRIVTKIHTQVTDALPTPLYFGIKEYKSFVDNILHVYDLLEDVNISVK